MRISKKVVLGAAVLTASAVAAFGPSAATAAAPPEVFSAFLNANTVSSNRFYTLPGLPAGQYSITAKAWAQNLSTTATVQVRCELRAKAITDPGADFDITEVTLAGNARQSMNLNVVHTFTSSSFARLQCQTTGGVQMNFIKVTATRVNQVTNQQLGVDVP